MAWRRSDMHLHWYAGVQVQERRLGPPVCRRPQAAHPIRPKPTEQGVINPRAHLDFLMLDPPIGPPDFTLVLLMLVWVWMCPI